MKRKLLMHTILFTGLGFLFTMAAVAGPHHWRGKDDRDVHAVLAEACAGKTEGDRVQVTTPRGGNLEALCATGHDGVLRARPARGLQHQEALLAACRDKKPGDKVSVETPCGVTIDGTCIQQGKDLRATVGNSWPCGEGHGKGSLRGYGPKKDGHSWKGNCPGYAPGHYKQHAAPGDVGRTPRADRFLDGVCDGKGKGAKIKFDRPDGTKVEITCGEQAAKTK